MKSFPPWWHSEFPLQLPYFYLFYPSSSYCFFFAFPLIKAFFFFCLIQFGLGLGFFSSMLIHHRQMESFSFPVTKCIVSALRTRMLLHPLILPLGKQYFKLEYNLVKVWMRATDLKCDSFSLDAWKRKSETNYCPMKKKVTHELSHIIRQQRLLPRKKEREATTLHMPVTGQDSVLFQLKLNSLSSFSCWGSWHFMPQQYLAKPLFFSI